MQRRVYEHLHECSENNKKIQKCNCHFIRCLTEFHESNNLLNAVMWQLSHEYNLTVLTLFSFPHVLRDC